MKKLLLLAAFAALLLTGCGQFVSRKLGGDTTIMLEKGERLVEATWKENSLWYLVEPMDSDYIPKTKVFKESSQFGVLEGNVIFVEQK